MRRIHYGYDFRRAMPLTSVKQWFDISAHGPSVFILSKIRPVAVADVVRKGPVRENTFRRNGHDGERTAEGAGRLRERDGLETEPVQLFEDAGRGKHGVHRGERRANSRIFRTSIDIYEPFVRVHFV